MVAGNNTLVYRANAGDVIWDSPPDSLLVNGTTVPAPSLTRVENVWVTGAPASLNNWQQFFLPVSNSPLTNLAVTGVTVMAGSPLAVLSGGFTDILRGTVADTDSATIDWGDGTTSVGNITFLGSGSGGGNFNVSGSHIYATNGPRIVVLTVVDPRNLEASVGFFFTGGLALDGSGNLKNYSSGSAFTTVDTGVSSYVARNLDGTVFALHTNGALWVIPSTGSKQQVDGGDQSIVLGPDGGLYALHADGNLYAAPAGLTNPSFVDSGVRAIVSDTAGDLYKLYTAGSTQRDASRLDDLDARC